MHRSAGQADSLRYFEGGECEEGEGMEVEQTDGRTNVQSLEKVSCAVELPRPEGILVPQSVLVNSAGPLRRKRPRRTSMEHLFKISK